MNGGRAANRGGQRVHMLERLDENAIVNVWASNLHQEMARILEILDEYPYVGMVGHSCSRGVCSFWSRCVTITKDTEFPGIVYHPQQGARSSFEYNYQTLKLNVDLLKIIQLGLCFCSEDARIYGPTVWQFNFKFDLQKDAHAQNSIDLLTKHGIQWKRHETDGIDAIEFAELLIASGVACNPGLFPCVFDERSR